MIVAISGAYANVAASCNQLLSIHSCFIYFHFFSLVIFTMKLKDATFPSFGKLVDVSVLLKLEDVTFSRLKESLDFVVKYNRINFKPRPVDLEVLGSRSGQKIISRLSTNLIMQNQ